MEDLSFIHVLVVDPVGHGKKLLRHLLGLLNAAAVSEVNDTGAALAALREKPFDAIFCFENAGPDTALEFCRKLRRDEQSMNMMIPVVLVTSAARSDTVNNWRDAGGNVALAMPLSADAVMARLGPIIKSPRHFVVSPAFVGPDRRKNDAPFRGSNRRREAAEGVKLLRPRVPGRDGSGGRGA
jgi:CheY-like chemotaxis protein